MPYIVGVDVGGTFTDASAVSMDTGEVYTAKARSTPSDLTVGLLDALSFLAERAGESLESFLADTIKFAHGTTQTSNVVFTWKGARTALITTKGFGDELHIMRARGRVAGLSLAARRHLRTTNKPPQIVPPPLVREVPERVDHRGRVLLPLTADQVVPVVDELVADGVEAIAVCLLWSSEYPDHELLVERVVRERAPHVYVSTAHRLAPVVGEYERATTAVINAFVGPTVGRYLEVVERELRERKLEAPLLILQANGGVAQARETVPVNTIESGPAAGMAATRSLAHATGHANVIATDVGGTTFKVGVVVDGQLSSARETIINQYSLLMPMVDVVSIGAGGGSIAWADGRRLRVGPMSAGADPGPACYGWGGDRPTVTDADVVLGFLNPDRFLGGRIRLQPERAREALRAGVAEALFDGDVVRAAAGVRTVVDAQMGDLIHKATLERGWDPRRFILAAYGGAGPVHACGYARAIDVRTIVVPASATVYSAYGAAASDIQHTLQRSVRPELLGDDAALRSAYRELADEAKDLVLRQNVTEDKLHMVWWADMRYERQLHDVRVTVPPDTDGGNLSTLLQDAFQERYEMLYGVGALLRDARIELLRVGIDAVGQIAKPPLTEFTLASPDAVPALDGTRPIFWPDLGEWVETETYDGEHLRPGNKIRGPAVIEQLGTTVVVPKDADAEIDALGNTFIHLGGAANS